jgi:hypothetical protein
MHSNMKAELLFRKREGLTETAFVELVIWRLLEPVRGSNHTYRYSLALVSEGVCVLGYDNEAGKGDHKHVADRKIDYRFVDLATLQTDFWADVKMWRTAQ